MKPEDVNALKSLARKCVAEIKQAWSEAGARTQKQKDAISKEILPSYEKRITPRYTLPYLNYYIGIHTGVLKERL